MSTQISFAVVQRVAKLTKLKQTSWMQLLSFFAFLALVSPTVINYRPYALHWDEAYYLGRAICVNRGVYDFSWSRLTDCFSHTHKGPIMWFVNLPWGPAGGTDRGIGLAFVGLAIFVWILAIATYLISVRGGISPSLLLLAGAAICLTRFLRASGGAMMTDMLLGWCIALGLMLIPLEYTSASAGVWPSIRRGLLWSCVINVGMLSKVTFAFFFCVIGVALLLIRERYSGEYPLRYAFFACIVGSLPTVAIWRYYGLTFLRFAVQVAWGQAALSWSVPGMTASGYLERYVAQLGFALIPLSILFFLFIRGLQREKEMRLGRLLLIGIILAYLALAARSQNRDPRFAIPVMIAMPICLTWTSNRREPSEPMGSGPIFTALIACTLVALPMIKRAEFGPIQHTELLLAKLTRHPGDSAHTVRVVIATDGPEFNIDTFLLAKQLGGEGLEHIGLDTLVYDAVNKRSLENGLKRIDDSNYVLFLRSGLTPGADWQRVWARDYRAHSEAVGTLLDPNISAEFDVFRIRSSGISTIQ